ncbi:MAG: hypothetical protein IJD85_00125 [Oscillospiraceae bacterium]|nr:hypothetical protein [Oscillospiraceae bacterium]
MKITKILAASAAAAVATSALAVSASAFDGFLMFADSTWAGWGCWNPEDCAAGVADVTTDGTYTVFIDTTLATSQVEDADTGMMVPATATGVQVFCVDIRGLADEVGCGTKGVDGLETTYDKMAYAQDAGLEVSDVSITMYNSDGTSTELDVDQSKIVFGDIEANGNLRIEICNPGGGGVTGTDCPIDSSLVSFDEKLEVTFTITGIDGDSADDAGSDDAAGSTDGATDENKNSADTGVEGVAAVAGVAVLAAGAVLLSKKRK